MKTIKLFEFFSGIGSQLKALKSLEEKLKFKTKSMGACDFYIDAIVSYMAMHYGILDPENNLDKQEMIEILEKYVFSSNSKDIVARDYFKRIKEDKLRNLFSYLYAFLNNEYFNDRYIKFSTLQHHSKRERERERFGYKIIH